LLENSATFISGGTVVYFSSTVSFKKGVKVMIRIHYGDPVHLRLERIAIIFAVFSEICTTFKELTSISEVVALFRFKLEEALEAFETARVATGTAIKVLIKC
jgi:hypothetical protein